MSRIVQSYHPEVRRTGRTIDELIAGTAFFPGGTGVWRGEKVKGQLPQDFPQSPIMLVAHNFDSVVAYERSKSRGGEVEASFFWKILRECLRESHVPPENCFFTNALMGLQPRSAVGPMPVVQGYEEQCREFLGRQFEIVGPQAVVALGRKARDRVRAAAPSVPWIDVLHPSAREFKPRATRSQLIKEQAARVRLILGSDSHA
jgi:hypothetical protein